MRVERVAWRISLAVPRQRKWARSDLGVGKLSGGAFRSMAGGGWVAAARIMNVAGPRQRARPPGETHLVSDWAINIEDHTLELCTLATSVDTVVLLYRGYIEGYRVRLTQFAREIAVMLLGLWKTLAGIDAERPSS